MDSSSGSGATAVVAAVVPTAEKVRIGLRRQFMHFLRVHGGGGGGDGGGCCCAQVANAYFSTLHRCPTLNGRAAVERTAHEQHEHGECETLQPPPNQGCVARAEAAVHALPETPGARQSCLPSTHARHAHNNLGRVSP